ncbi:14822_t:CDS:2 [Cetraspora pellucida]|uniref:14822_t:CDS:1 n=1 Tax=Cetraspora pellucida TaxID=1433469 RepID=A0ACA9JW36_9GLOM|nr:14822_t:CDS:2 [Cetraspora pellucida]
MPSKNKSVLNQKTTKYEFLGPIGAFLMITVLPILVYVLHLSCQFDGHPSRELIVYLSDINNLKTLFTLSNIFSLFDPTAFLAYIIYLAYLIVIFYLIPGRWVEGTQLRDGTKLKYKENGFYNLTLTLFIILIILSTKGHEPFLFIDHHFIGLITASTIVSFALSFYVYLASFQEGKLLALELNPRIGSFDIKYFVELRPGIICWIIVNISMAIKQYHDLGYVTIGMFLIVIFQGWYCVDALYNEPAVLTTMDITTDGFGWMLSFGNFTWVGFLYGLQARYLALHPVYLSRLQIIFIICLQAIGYTIFRGANNEKNHFRNNPEDPKYIELITIINILCYDEIDLKYITTEAGSRLIISGWWGRARHINYLGDWIISWAWCLLCGFDDIIPYFYVIYFAVLLIHRERRDEEKCKKKYKKDWDKYCEIVKWRIVPELEESFEAGLFCLERQISGDVQHSSLRTSTFL